MPSPIPSHSTPLLPIPCVHAGVVACVQNNPFARPFIEALDGMGLSQGATPFDNGVLCISKDVLMPYLVNLEETVRGYAA